MKKNHVEVWANCLRFIKDQINEQSFKTWFEPIKSIGIKSNSLVIQVPNKYFYEWLEEKYIGLLKKALIKELGNSGRLEYQILREAKKAETKPSKSKKESTFDTDTTKVEDIKNPFVIPGIKKVKIDPQLSKKYTFDNFVEGSCNKLARSAGKAISDRPGGTSFNPLVIFSEVGLGKTHLAQAIGNATLEKHKNKNVLYVTSERFTNQIIQAIKTNAVNDFMNFYQMIDVLIVDDIQFLSGRTKTQEIFFNIFNQLHQNQKQIILTSDKPPKDLEGIEERLISRFKWGLSADLQIPDMETRKAILRQKMKSENVDFDEKIVEFICYNVKNNIREIEGVFVSLVAHSTLNQKEIDLDLAREVVKNFISDVNKEITLEGIQNLVSEHFNVPVEKIQGKTRKRSVVIARQLSMYLAKNLTKNSLKSIGENFGGRDHSTVIYSCRAVQDLMDTDLLFKDTVSELQKKVQLSING